MGNNMSIKKVCQVTREIKVSGSNSDLDVSRIKSELMCVEGVLEINFKLSSQKAMISYDLDKLNYEDVLEEIKLAGFFVESGIFSKLKQQWVAYLDSNIKDNSHLPPAACCNKPPKIK